MHNVLSKPLVKHAQDKSVVKWADCPDMTIAVVWDVKHETKLKTYLASFIEFFPVPHLFMITHILKELDMIHLQ